MNFRYFLKDLITNRAKRDKLITFGSAVYNVLWSIAKIVIGIISQGYFFCINGVGTLLTGYAKYTYFLHYDTQDEAARRSKAAIINILLIIIGVFYISYMARLFVWTESTKNYGTIISLTIALCSFVELGISIKNLVKAIKSNDIMHTSLRGLNLANACFSIVLTQIVLFALCNENKPFYNALTGTIFGAFACFIGIIGLLIAPKNKK